MKGPMPLELPKYEPTPIPKALKQKPKESKITFQGVGQTGIRFLIPQRKLGFEDYLSFVAVTLFIFFMSYMCYRMVVMWGTLGWILSTLVVMAIMAFIAYEFLHFKESQALEIQPGYFKVFKTSPLGNKEFVIPIRDILKVQVATSSPTVTYIDHKDGESKELIFLEYSSRREKEWFVVLLRSVVYNLTKRII